MADIIIKGAGSTVELERAEDQETYETFYTIKCDKGAWCSVPAIEPRSVWNIADAMEYAEMHADSVH